VKGVHTGVHGLHKAGLIDRVPDGFEFPFDTVRADFVLRAAAQDSTSAEFRAGPPRADRNEFQTMLTDDVLRHIDRGVLCWLATVDIDGGPNVSPKVAQPNMIGSICVR
jgi:predicted pyridoxine 5'-phosphate oxidase superfamily flavin-nucleotide-binding protein